MRCCGQPATPWVRARFYGLLDTLRYLEKGGRIGKAQAFVGSLLQIKPLLTIRDGEAHPLERARSRAKGTQRLYDLAVENARCPTSPWPIPHPDEAQAWPTGCGHCTPTARCSSAR